MDFEQKTKGMTVVNKPSTQTLFIFDLVRY